VRPTGPMTDDGQPLAGFWRRGVALVLDTLIGILVALPFSLPAQIDSQRESAAAQRELQRRIEAGEPISFDAFMDSTFAPLAEHWVALLLLPALVVLAYHAVMLRRFGATLGKLALDLRVRPRDAAGPLSWATIARRLGVQLLLVQVLQAVALLSGSWPITLTAYGVILVFAFADPLWATGSRRQTLHDRAARTVVVRTD
jgi:uncharacterized RDD family membrane protein YckC